MVSDPDNYQNSSKSPGIISIAQSVLAAMFGVQSDEKRKQDFEQGKPSDYIFAGIIGVLLFIFGVIAFVNYLISSYNAGN